MGNIFSLQPEQYYINIINVIKCFDNRNIDYIT